MEAAIQKGSRIRAKLFIAEPFKSSLAGVQLKTSATLHQITGIIRHIRCSDSNFAPEDVIIFMETDDGSGELCSKCGCKEIQIKTKHIVEVLSV